MLAVPTGYLNCETLTWETRKGPDINNPPADNFFTTPYPGGMTTFCQSAQPYAGALTRPVDLPLIVGSTRFALSYAMRPSGNAFVSGQVFEFDLMATASSGSVMNMSCQYNIPAQSWQIAKAGGGWTDPAAMGFKTPLVSDWTAVRWDAVVDYTKGLVSMQSITVNGTKHAIPVALQNVPFMSIIWAPNIGVLQRQLCLNGNAGGGAYSVDDRDIMFIQQ